MKISICIPCFEQVEYLAKCMDSIVSQTYLNYEVIISDDSITDGVRNYVIDLEKVFNGKLFYFRNSPSKGTPGNWNQAMDMATGDFIHLLHHDDYYTSPNSLQALVDAARLNDDTGVFIGEVVSHNISSNTLTKLIVTDQYLSLLHKKPVEIFYANLLGPPSIVFFRNKAKEYFDVNMKWLVDMEYYYRLFRANKNWRFIHLLFITSVNNAGHNVTNDCLLNPKVEVYEYLYFYNKHFRSIIPSLKMLRHFRMLINRYGIFSIAELNKYSRDVRIPLFIYLLIYTSRFEYIFKQKK